MNPIPQLNKKHLVFTIDQRKRKLETLIMKKFITLKGTKSSNPKKEYVRCRVIRGHKKMIRTLLENSIPRKGIAKFTMNNKFQTPHSRKFQDHLTEHREELLLIALTESGPLTDGKSKVKPEDRSESQSSYNNEFCKEYFKSEVVRTSFKLFFEVVFAKFKPSSLRKRFGFQCCDSETHVLECFEKWQCLKYYLQNELFLTLDFNDEYFDESNKQTLPDIIGVYELEEFINNN